MKAVWTTFGCCAAAAAPTGPPVPLTPVSLSGVGAECPPWRSLFGLPLLAAWSWNDAAWGDRSIGSQGECPDEVAEDGSIGRSLELAVERRSLSNAPLRMGSPTDVIVYVGLSFSALFRWSIPAVNQRRQPGMIQSKLLMIIVGL